MLRNNENAVAGIIGAVLLLAIAITVLSIYQAVTVPSENMETEFIHNQNIQQEMQHLRNDIIDTASTGTTYSTSLTLGTQYKQRLIGVNPPPPSGTLQTTWTTTPGNTITIKNAEAATNKEEHDYWNGNTHTWTTAAITYTPHYNEYTTPPITTYENTIIYNNFDTANATFPLTDQLLIKNTHINLIALNGTYTTNGDTTTSLDTNGLSTSINKLILQNTTNTRINITIPTTLKHDQWTTLLQNEITNGNIEQTRYNTTGPIPHLTITLSPNTTYAVRISKIGIGDNTQENTSRYLIDTEGDGATMNEENTLKLVATLKDGLGNPVPGEKINTTITGSGTITPSTATTDSDGNAIYTYTAPPDVDTDTSVTIETTIGQNPGPPQTATFNITVIAQ